VAATAAAGAAPTLTSSSSSINSSSSNQEKAEGPVATVSGEWEALALEHADIAVALGVPLVVVLTKVSE
jgi:hypothetical protein